MSLLPQIERELLDAHTRLNGAYARDRRARWARAVRSRRAGLGAVAIGLVLAGAATAARQLFFVGNSIPPAPQPYAVVAKGAPAGVGPTPAEAARMLKQIGRPLPRTVRTYVVEPDPVGGPPWGLLVYRTSTGTVCEHGGRVVDGRVGILDAHGALHPWTADLSGCTGWGFASRPVQAEGGSLAYGGAPVCAIGGVAGRNRRHVVACAPNALRIVVEGVLPPRVLKHDGPAAVRLTVSRPGDPTVTESLHGGAFIYVALGNGGLTCTRMPILSTRYADGTSTREALIPKSAQLCQPPRSHSK
jgi:hypothetical protein